MRFAASETIYDAAIKDPRIYFLTGDTGHARQEEFRKNLPKQYINTGMAEQNMVGTAAGLALSGMKVFTWGIVPFLVLRAFEQVKVDVCYQNVDVTLIGVGGGFAYGVSGGTHYSIEEIAALRALPNMKIVAPATPQETRKLTSQIIKAGGPTYMRIGRGAEPDLPSEPGEPVLGKALVMRPGKDATLFSAGTIVLEALRVADMLIKKGIDLEVVNMHTIKPLDAAAIVERMKNNKPMFVLEEHNFFGGLGGAIAEVLAEESDGAYRGIFKRFGVQDVWPKFVGSQQFLRDAMGISAEKVAPEIARLLS